MRIRKTPPTAGERVKLVRLLAGIPTRKAFEKTSNISCNTLQGWEQGKNRLPAKGAQRIADAVKSYGILCSIDWLMRGTGEAPRLFSMIESLPLSYQPKQFSFTQLKQEEDELIYKEMQFFKSNVPNSLVITVFEDAMEPFYSVGDCIGGVKVFQENIENYLGQHCIVELENNLIMARHLLPGSQRGRYTLVSTNSKTTATGKNQFDVCLLSVAPIIWHRRKLSALH